MSNQLPDPCLRKVYRLEAALAQPLDLGDTVQGHRRTVRLTAGTFTQRGHSRWLLRRPLDGASDVRQCSVELAWSPRGRCYRVWVGSSSGRVPSSPPWVGSSSGRPPSSVPCVRSSLSISPLFQRGHLQAPLRTPAMAPWRRLWFGWTMDDVVMPAKRSAAARNSSDSSALANGALRRAGATGAVRRAGRSPRGPTNRVCRPTRSGVARAAAPRPPRVVRPRGRS